MRPLFSFVAAALLVGCASDSPQVARQSTLDVRPSLATVTLARELATAVDADLPGCDDALAHRTLSEATQVKLTAIQSSDLVIASIGKVGVCVDTLMSLEITLPKLATASRVSSNPMPGTDPAASNPMPGDDKGGSNPMPGTDPTAPASSNPMPGEDKGNSNPMPGTGR